MDGDNRPEHNSDLSDKQRADGSSDSDRILDSKFNLHAENAKGTPGTGSPNPNRDDKNEHNAKSTGDKKQVQMKPTIKENWEKVDELCPTCGHVTKEAKGITRQNMRKLLIPKFTLNEAIYTFIIIVVLALGFLYMSETAQCRDFAHRLQTNPQETCDMLLSNQSISGGKGISMYSTGALGPGSLGKGTKLDNYSFNTNELTNPPS